MDGQAGSEEKTCYCMSGWLMVVGTILSSNPEGSGNRATAAMRSRVCSHDSMRKLLPMFPVKFAPLEQMGLGHRWEEAAELVPNRAAYRTFVTVPTNSAIVNGLSRVLASCSDEF